MDTEEKTQSLFVVFAGFYDKENYRLRATLTFNISINV